MKREIEFDVMRGILVLLVVLGHVIQQLPQVEATWGKAVSDVIYSFHMPAFAFVSGLCSVRILSFEKNTEAASYVGSRARRLLIPYLVWGALYLGLRSVMGEHARVPYDLSSWPFFFLGYNPDGAMWFLWTLFVTSAVTVLCAPLLRRGRWVAMAVMAVSVGCLVLMLYPAESLIRRIGSPLPVLVAVRALWIFTMLMMTGVMTRRVYERTKDSVAVLAIGSIVSVGLFVACDYGRVSHVFGPFPWYAPASICAAFGLLWFSTLLSRFLSAIAGPLAWLGTYAMAVYVFGEPIKVAGRILVKAVGLPSGLAFLLMFAATLLLPIAIMRLAVSKNRILSMALLGK